MASSHKEAAEKYVDVFCDFVNAGGYLPQHVFNFDETRLFLKNMTIKSYITKEERSTPGYKSMKNRSLF